MRKVAFTLTMPNVGSWNGRWTGEENLYVIIKSFTNIHWEEIKNKVINGGYYNFGDGWGASVDVKEVTPAEAKQLKRRSAGFCGYNWMVDSLIEFGEILNTAERVKRRDKEGNDENKF